MEEFDSKIKRNIEDIYDLLNDVQAAPKVTVSDTPRQIIFYGAPGTGKSFYIKQHTSKKTGIIRTTFHPDSDYSTFVGSYKPTTVEESVMTVIGTNAVPVEYKDGSCRKESKIIYDFVNQSFLDSYIEAWSKLCNAENWENVQEQYLIIEEINRGNCAQIFGDLFQLLDRNDFGFSDYPIKADADIQRQLRKAFHDKNVNLKDSINELYPEYDNIVDNILSGKLLVLPNNLYIWATMNTSDQSLFPIDSAFKRRWDWKYIPIYNANKGYVIQVGDNTYDWWDFLCKINAKIDNFTHSEDKKLGYFFCKAKEKVISVEMFVGKVIFYLWNDVFKDFELEDSIFNDADGSKLAFNKFYITDTDGNTNIASDKVDIFLKNLGVNAIVSNEPNDEDLQEE